MLLNFDKRKRKSTISKEKRTKTPPTPSQLL
jgi:hypothetical protein